jgi:hypothetical protein
LLIASIVGSAVDAYDAVHRFAEIDNEARERMNVALWIAAGVRPADQHL